MSFKKESIDFNKNIIDDSDEEFEAPDEEFGIAIDDLHDILGYDNINFSLGDDEFN